MRATIYTLSDLDGNIFYVGCTERKLSERLSAHISEAKKGRGNKEKNRIIVELEFKVVITEIDSCPLRNRTDLMRANRREEQWIVRFRENGHTLCNIRPREKKYA